MIAALTPSLWMRSGLVLQACVQCGQTKTPLWRSGPAGPKTLCNACGVHYQRTVRRSKSSTPRAAGKPQSEEAHPSGDQHHMFYDEPASFPAAKRSGFNNEDQPAPISTASEPESLCGAPQLSKRPRRQRRRRFPGSPTDDRSADRMFTSEGTNRLDTLVAAAGEETDWHAREEDDHSGQTTQRVCQTASGRKFLCTKCHRSNEQHPSGFAVSSRMVCTLVGKSGSGKLTSCIQQDSR